MQHRYSRAEPPAPPPRRRNVSSKPLPAHPSLGVSSSSYLESTLANMPYARRPWVPRATGSRS
eukprot:12831387-Alexandrium_andersonii.AAC.1